MACPQGIVVLVGQLDYRSAELCQILLDQIGQLVAGKYGLFLKYADIAPCLNEFGLDIPESGITQEICVVVEETRRSDNLSVACSLHIDHLGRFRTHQYDKTVLLLFLGQDRQAEKHCQQ